MIKVAFSKTFSFSILANSFFNKNLIQDMNMLFATFVMIYWLLPSVCLSEVIQAQFFMQLLLPLLWDRIYQLVNNQKK